LSLIFKVSVERWFKLGSVAEKTKSESITNRERINNKMPEDKSVAADKRLIAEEKHGFRNSEF
jgi:hypothetical protein